MIKLETRQEVLSNGLTLIGEVNPTSKSSGIGFFVRTGARDEVKEESGVSHFLEHMMFKATHNRSALDLTYEMGNIGAQSNAYTSEESTVYYAGVIPEYFSQMQEILSDMMMPLLAEEEFETEKKVILEEIAQYQDRPQFYLFESAVRSFFKDHPAGNSVLGSEESIAALTSSAMKDYHRRRYTPDQIVLVASGNFSWSTFCEDAKSQCGDWQGSSQDRSEIEFEFAPAEDQILFRKELHHSHDLFIGPGVSSSSSLRYPLALLSNIIGDSQGSRMYWELVDTGLADFAGCDSDQKFDTGCMLAYASGDPEKIDEISQRMESILSDPMDFTESTLERVKTKVITRIVLSGELPMGRLMALGNEWLSRKRLHSLQQQIEQVRSVRVQDIQQVVDQIQFGKWNKYRLMPE